MLNGWLKNTTNMETKFNFKSSVCTSREQSERLLALGLKKDTADMYLQSVLNDEWSPFVPIAFPYSDRPEEIIAPDIVNAIPAWSLHRLLMMTTNKRKVMLIRCESDLYDVVIKKIEREIEEGYFNKEYLV